MKTLNSNSMSIICFRQIERNQIIIEHNLNPNVNRNKSQNYTISPKETNQLLFKLVNL